MDRINIYGRDSRLWKKTLVLMHKPDIGIPPTDDDIQLLTRLGLLDGWSGYFSECLAPKGWSRWRVSLIVPKSGPLSGLCKETLQTTLEKHFPELELEPYRVEELPFNGTLYTNQRYLDFTVWSPSQGSPEHLFTQHCPQEDITLYRLT
jgi:hypothetical protein